MGRGDEFILGASAMENRFWMYVRNANDRDLAFELLTAVLKDAGIKIEFKLDPENRMPENKLDNRGNV